MEFPCERDGKKVPDAEFRERSWRTHEEQKLGFLRVYVVPSQRHARSSWRSSSSRTRNEHTRTKRRFGRDARPIIIITGIHGAQLGRAKDRRRTVACIALLSSFIPLDFHPCVPCIDYKYHDRVITHMCNYTGSSRYYIIFGFVTFRFNRLESRLHAFLRRTIALSLSVSAGFQLAPWNLSITYAFLRILSRLFYLNYRAD